MKGIQPWGRLTEIISEFPGVDWHCICCASFEVRSTHVPLALDRLGCLSSVDVLRVDPPSDAGGREECIAGIEETIGRMKHLPKAGVTSTDLLGSMSVIIKMVNSLPSDSVILDITGMPKRFFMFLAIKLMDRPTVKNLVVTYTKPGSYPEGALATDPEPVAALPGFGRQSSSSAAGATMIVGVGYIQFSLGELLEQSKGMGLKFLMPFPPGAPSARRNWTLLHHMDPNVEMLRDIRRVHAMDMFEALDWINECIDDLDGGAIDMIPLGPKPHSLAMALAYRSRPEQVQVLYAQPHTYRSNYSSGVGVDFNGEIESYGYCLKFDGEDCV